MEGVRIYLQGSADTGNDNGGAERGHLQLTTSDEEKIACGMKETVFEREGQ